jgi:hypothetical protein
MCRVVMDKSYGIRQRMPSLALRPIDHLKDVRSGDVVGGCPSGRRGFAAAVQVDAEPWIGLLPATVTFVYRKDRYVSQLTSVSQPPGPKGVSP